MKYGNISLQAIKEYNDSHYYYKHLNYDKNLKLTYVEPTQKEVQELANKNDRYSEQYRIDIATKYDETYTHFLNEFKKRNKITDKVKRIVNNLGKLCNYYVTKYKLKFNAARPFQLANKYNIELYPVALSTTHTPSYPSGHAAHFHAYYLLFTQLDPNGNYKKIRDKGLNSRIISGVHFEQDNEASIAIVNELFNYIEF